MTGKKWLLAALLLACGLLFGSCGIETTTNNDPMPERTQVPVVTPFSEGSLPLVDSSTVYDQDDPGSVATFYLTIKRGRSADNTDHSFEDVNSVLRLQGMNDVAVVSAEVLVQEGDELGPMPGHIGYGETMANGSIRIRGRTSTGYTQKSYRIDLMDWAGLWRGQRAIAINKHPADHTRLRNKLFFDLLREIPGATSLRTQFAHVFIKDETCDPPQTAFVDFGLYTQVELPNGRYLRNHELSREGNLYKANMCEMRRYPEIIMLASDPDYDLSVFSTVLEPKTSEDHSKLIAMLDAVNDYSIPIEDVIGTYFNVDNLTSFLAFNILMGNVDSDAQNYLLYSPASSGTWYYIFWDGDGALSSYEDRLLDNKWAEASWTRGVSNYWANVLFNRMLRIESYRKALDEKMTLLRGIVTPEHVREMIGVYQPIVEHYMTSMPDKARWEVTMEQFHAILEEIPLELDESYENYLASLKKPMPFFLGDMQKVEDGLRVEWDESFDFGGELLHYSLEVASDWNFASETIVYEAADLLKLGEDLPMLEPGEYFYRVIVHNADGEEQIPFDQVETPQGIHAGMRRFTITPTGEVEQ